MFESLPFETFDQLAGEGCRVPVTRRIPADLITPVSAFRSLAEPGAGAFLLESTEGEGDVGRYSFLGFDPKIRFRAAGGESVIVEGMEEVRKEGQPLQVLRHLLARFRTVRVEGLPPLVGGAVGFMAYDAVRLFERIPDRHPNEEAIPDLSFGLYDTVLSFDHFRKTVTVTHVVDPGTDPKAAYEEGMARIGGVISKMLAAPLNLGSPAGRGEDDGVVEADMDDAAYAKAVARAKEYIAAGDVFQVVLSRRFRRMCSVPPFDVYRALRMVNPSPYMFYLQDENGAVAGSSPERLVRAEDGLVETMPIAGTRPRGVGEEDLRLERELLSDPKEKSEHMMLVDLARNDIGRISDPGTVEVTELAGVQRLSKVMHLVSRVKGRLREDLDGLDGLEAAMPAGTLSGAPKIRAMEIIDELETSRRGVYGGAVCYVDNRGNTDSCIAIRMASVRNGRVTVRAGAGIVHDSVPEREAQETLDKASAVLEAVRLAEEGL